MTVGQFVVGLALFYLITNFVEFIFTFFISDKENPSDFAIIKFSMGFVTLLFFLFFSVFDFGITIKDSNISHFCYNSTVNFESYEIQDEYIYLTDSNNDIQIYPLVAGAKIENGECANE